MATIRKRGDRWQAQVRRKGHPPQTRSFVRKQDATKWAREVEADHDRSGAHFGAEPLHSATVADLLSRYLTTVTPQKKGAKAESERLRWLQTFPFADLTLDRVSGATFASYRDERLKRVKPATVRRELVILQHVFRVANQEWGYAFQENPVAKVAKPQDKVRRDRRLTARERRNLIEAAKACRNPEIGPLIELAMLTGMRRSELLSLRWEDVDWKRRLIRLRTSKTGTGRVIPLLQTTVVVLRRVASPDSLQGRMFTTSANGLRQSWQRVRSRADMADVRFHDLRHEAISTFFELGLSVAEVASISGHRDYGTLSRYTHLQPSTIAAKLDGPAPG